MAFRVREVFGLPEPRLKTCYSCIANAIQEVRPMKSASTPSLRVQPGLREASEFMVRGLASRDEARRTGEYVDVDVVHAELHDMLVKAEAAQGKR
jgi:hypothetical protein